MNEIETEALLRAIKIAEFGLYSTTPNPRVGAVIIKNGKIVAEGFHQKAGAEHAEINAINNAQQKGIDLRGATMAVSLEPCCHFNRTPPCSKRLIAEGFSKVLIATIDPNPKVAGGGVAELKNAGIAVEFAYDDIKTLARKLNFSFFYKQQTGLPWTNLKLALFKNGATAFPANTQLQWISNLSSRADVQYWRARSCAILTTAQSVITDNPKLNVRNPPKLYPEQINENSRQPLKIILDRENKLFNIAQAQKLNIFNSGEVLSIINCEAPQKSQLPENINWQFLKLQVENENYFKSLFNELGKLAINELIIEAGAGLAQGLLAENYINQLTLYYASEEQKMGLAINKINSFIPEQLSINSQWQIDDKTKFDGDERVILYSRKDLELLLKVK